MELYKKIACIVPLLFGAVLLIPLEQKLVGYLTLGLGMACSSFMPRTFSRHIVLVYFAVAILGLTPISTDISFWHIFIMGSSIGLAVLIPFVITRFAYKEKVIQFPFHKHAWTSKHIGYLILTAVLSYFLLPYWMQTTGGHLAWAVPTDPGGLFVLFLGTNALGIWDELFFIVTILALLRRHFSFGLANAIQAVLFTAFLYELGFQGWIVLIIYPFALLQGIVFKKTENLAYVIAIHLTIDLVLYLALINAHHPELLDIFVSKYW